ncbi:MAG: class I adenylate-forming enzyme family protein, partial [Solirubrobacterales bacterium]|nr:class I adenylate-forming enzyme family protein [Solirubrobacterales bacterium]
MKREAQPQFFSMEGLLARGQSSTVTDRAGSWSGVQAHEKSSAVCAWLGGLDLADRTVALEVPSGRDWLAAAAGTLMAGHRLVPVNSQWPPALRAVSLDGAIHITPDVLESVYSAREEEGSLGEGVEAQGLESSLLLMTSGSTSSPVPVVHTASSIFAQASLGAAAVGLTSDSHWLIPMPMVHAGGIGALVRCIYGSAEMTLLADFDAGECIRLIEGGGDRNPVTHVSLVPTMLRRLLDEGLSNPSELQMALIGGAPLDADLRNEAVARGIPVRESWGMTETLGLISFCRSDSDTGAGQMLEGLELRVSDDSELQIKGPTIAPESCEADGWLATGDAGFVQHECVHVTGRLGTVIISGGENISPERVEEALRGLTGIEDAAVFGVSDPVWGQRVEAQIVVTDGVTLTEAEVLPLLSGMLSPWEIPKAVHVVGSVPRGPL